MKGRKAESLIRKYILPHLPDFSVRRALLFAQPLRYILRGYCFESSGFDASDFYVNVFAQPLFVPDTCIVLSKGDRLRTVGFRPVAGWTLGDDEAKTMRSVLASIQRHGTSFIEKVGTLQGFVKYVIKSMVKPYNLHDAEMAAYGSVLLGNEDTAIRMFDRVAVACQDAASGPPWVGEVLERANKVRRAFERNPEDALAILHGWRHHTAEALKLTEFLDSDIPDGQHPRS